MGGMAAQIPIKNDPEANKVSIDSRLLSVACYALSVKHEQWIAFDVTQCASDKA